MGRPKVERPMVVVAARIPADLERRIKRIGPTSRVMRAALERGVASLERERIEKFVLARVQQALKLEGGHVWIPALRQGIPELDARSLDRALRSLARLRAFELRKAAQPALGGIDVPGQGMMMWVARRSRRRRES